MQYDLHIYTMAQAIEYPRIILDTSQLESIRAYDNRLQHNYDVTNLKSKYSN